MNMPILNFGNGLFRGPVPNRINWDDRINPLPSGKNCRKCLKNFEVLMSENSDEYDALTVEQKISLLEEIVYNLRVIRCIFGEKSSDFYDMELEIEKTALKEMKLLATEQLPTLSLNEHLALLGVEPIRANGTMSEISKKMGDLFLNSKNSNGDHLFDIDGVRIAKLICVLFILSSGKELKQHSVEKAVGQGRNLYNQD